MRELAIVLGITGLLCVLSAAWLAPWEELYYTGVWMTAAGFAFGLPTGFIYHVVLYRALRPRGELPRGWYWRPLRFNDRLLPEERGRVMSWCYAGAVGFAVISIGLLLMGTGVLVALFRGV